MIAATVIVFLSPAREKLLNDEPAENESRMSSQWAGGIDTTAHHLPSHQDNVIHHDFGGGPLDPNFRLPLQVKTCQVWGLYPP